MQLAVDTLTIRIDNRRIVNISEYDYAHAYTNETQTIWNGILGEFYLSAREKTWIASMEVRPDFNTGITAGQITISGVPEKDVSIRIELFTAEAGISSYIGSVWEPVLEWRITVKNGDQFAAGSFTAGPAENGTVTKLFEAKMGNGSIATGKEF